MNLTISNKKCFIAFVFCFVFTPIIKGQTKEDSIILSKALVSIDSIMKADNQNAVEKVIDYYLDSSKINNKHFDVKFAAAPLYQSETSLGLVAMMDCLYKRDSISPLSNMIVQGKGTITGFYKFVFKGNHFCNLDKIRLLYDVSFKSYPHYFWGVGFDNGDNNQSRTEMTEKAFKAEIEVGFKLARNLYLGPVGSYDWIYAKNLQSDSLLEGVSKRSSTINLGAILYYDSRDILYNPHRGLYLKLEQDNLINPGNKPFFKTIGDIRGYIHVWKGGTLALRGYLEHSYGEVPWTMKAKGDGLSILRSYYEGRYRDDNLIYATAELRQHIWNRFGAVLWIGAGNVYSKENPFDWNHTLSDIGTGIRWEFKKKINFRLDFGIGRSGQHSFVFGVREAF